MIIKKDWFQALTAKMKTNRKLEFAVYGGLLLIVLVLCFSLVHRVDSVPSNSMTADSDSVLSLGEQEVERRLEDTLSKIRGAGRVEVMITYETGPEIVTAMNTDLQENSTQNSSGTTESSSESMKPATVSRSGTNEPIVLTERQPTIRGVIVIAEGAEDISVRMDLINAAKTVLGISLDRIEVFEMTGE